MSERPPLPRGIRPLLAALFFATVGVFVQATALGKQVYDITGRPLDLGLLGLAEFLPTALLAPLTGSVADRFDRRLVVALGFGGEAACSAGLALYALSDPTSIAPILVLVVLFGVARAFVAPASRALPVDLAEPAGAVTRVIPLTSIVWQVAFIVGPVAGGFLYVPGAHWPYGVACVLALVGAATVLSVHLPARERLTSPPGARAVLHDALEGLRFIRRTPILLGAISLDLLAVLFGGAIALLPAIADERLGVGAVGLGWLRAAVGIGAGLTTLVLAVRPVNRRVGVVLFVAVGIFGVATIVLGLTRSYAVAFAALLVASGADAVSVFIRATLVPLVTAPSMRGRVLAVENVFIGASNELGAFESGVAGALLGAAGAVVLGGAATLVVVAVWATLFPALRSVDRFRDAQAAVAGDLPPSELRTEWRATDPSGRDPA